MGSNYEKGRAREYQCMRMLEKEGYLTLRMAGSHSPFDVIAFLVKNKENLPLVRAIQCKAGASPYKKAMKELEELALPLIIQKELWVWKPRKPLKVFVIPALRFYY